MSRPLFLPSTIGLEKVAFSSRLDEDPDEWPVSILSEAYKQLPFLKSLETDVELERVDEARGYAVGKMLIYPHGMQKEAAAENKKLISVPVIVRDRELSPLDVFSFDGSMRPMDQDDIEQMMHRPEVFEGAAPRGQFTGTNLYGQLTPPNTDHQYNAGTLHKHGSAEDAFADAMEKLAQDPAAAQVQPGGGTRGMAALGGTLGNLLPVPVAGPAVGAALGAERGKKGRSAAGAAGGSVAGGLGLGLLAAGLAAIPSAGARKRMAKVLEGLKPEQMKAVNEAIEAAMKGMDEGGSPEAVEEAMQRALQSGALPQALGEVRPMDPIAAWAPAMAGAAGMGTGSLVGGGLGAHMAHGPNAQMQQPQAMKAASANMWKEASQTFRPGDVEAFKSALKDSPPLRDAFLNNDILRPYVGDLLDYQEKTASDIAATRAASTKPTVVQFVPKGKGFLIKHANHNCYAPKVKEASRFDVQKMLSKENFNRLLDAGHLTMTVDPVDQGDITVKTAQEADRFGRYQVWSGGKRHEGLVIPNVIDLDGHDLHMQIFAGDDRHSLQEKVAGVFLEDVTYTGAEPRGPGVLVYQEGAKALALEPVDVKHSIKVAHSTGDYYTLEATRLSTGERIRIVPVDGIQKVATIGNEVMIPANFRWCSLEGKQVQLGELEFLQALEGSEKVANVNSVEIISDGSFYSLRGSNADVFKKDIFTAEEAEFALGALGITGSEASSLLKLASKESNTIVPRTRKVSDELDVAHSVVVKTASAMGRVPDLKVNLMKEAALIASPKADAFFDGIWKEASVVHRKETVDAILSLGFITPENASLYVNYLPELEKVSSRLAELLVASRLGMDDVREAAAKNAMTQMNSVIKGLETLRERIQ
jgi:hypothetical protein